MKYIGPIFIIAMFSIMFSGVTSTEVRQSNQKIMMMVEPFVKVNRASGSVIRSFKSDGLNYSYVLTCSHVIEDKIRDENKVLRLTNQYDIPGEFYVRDGNGRIVEQHNLNGRVITFDEHEDFAIILYQTPKQWPTVKVANKVVSASLSLFDEIFSVGKPNNENLWVSEGIISTLEASRAQRVGCIGYTADGWYGSSGGPLFNENYEQIGVNVRISVSSKGALDTMMYSVPIYRIYTVLGPTRTSKYFGLEE